MTRFGKVMAVFVLFASMAFMGFAAVSTTGGINWNAEKGPLERDYIFEYSGGEKPTWSVKKRRGGEGIGHATPVLPQAIVAVRQDQIAAQKEEIDRLAEQIPRLKARIDESRKLIEIDTLAMKTSGDQLSAELAQQDASIDEVAKEGDKTAQDALSVRTQAERRREDVFRLRSQLEEVQTDRFQIDEQKRRIRDLLTRIDGVNDRLERRKLQLEAVTKANTD